jgi:hypothetical protein
MTKLSEIQQKLKAPKGQFNKFGGYKYRSCEDILEAVKPLLGDSVLTVTDEIVQVGERYYVKATASVNCEEGKTTAVGWAREAETKKGMDESQITGTASSYARKYALNGLFCIDDTKDADATNSHGKPAVSKEATAQLSEACKRYAEAAGQDLAAIKKAVWEELRGKDEAAFKSKTQQLNSWVDQNGGN